MFSYFGMGFLQHLRSYYSARLSLALKYGYDREGTQYRWLYAELNERVHTLKLTELFLAALPNFMMEHGGGEVAMTYVVNFFYQWFSDGFFGADPDEGPGSFYSPHNPYWADLSEMDEVMGLNYDMRLIPQVYIDLCEYTIRAIRLYFQIRECRVYAVDRSSFDAVMGLKTSLPPLACW